LAIFSHKIKKNKKNNKIPNKFKKKILLLESLTKIFKL